MNSNIPAWLNNQLTPQDLEQLALAVAQAEANTSAEIVPMIVHRSAIKYPELKMIYWVCGLASFFTINPIFLMVAGLIYRWHKKIKHQQIISRAIKEFYQSNIPQTALHTGVLIMVSWEEKQIVILADERIDKYVAVGEWSRLIKRTTGEIKQLNLSFALNSLISEVGKICAEIAPRSSNDTNELSDQLVIKE